MINIDGNSLTIKDLADVARDHVQVNISDAGHQNIIRSNERLSAILKQGKPVYGINTGFGIFSDRRINDSDSAKLSRNLILSHSVGVGSLLEDEIVRAAMLVRANALTAGYSGVRVEIVERLIEMLNLQLTPEIPSQGSLGSSGDLCMLSQLALTFTTDVDDLDDQSGRAFYQNKNMSGKEAMKLAGLKRIILGPKEGLALTNGASFSAALAALLVDEVDYLLKAAVSAIALSTEALLGCSAAFDPRLHSARHHPGQIYIAQKIAEKLKNSTFMDSGNRVQDAYSIRCVPQVLGPVYETLEFIRPQIEREINAATDNPLIFEDNNSLSGGNFHGEIVGIAMDYCGIVVAEMGAIAERRIYRLLDSSSNAGLPPMLVDSPEDAGLNSGYMMPHYTAAALALENQTLAHPDSVHSLPTSSGQEDHNANAWTAARHASQIMENVRTIIAIEMLCAARAIDLRLNVNPNLQLGQGTQLLYDQIRSIVPQTRGDQFWQPAIQQISMGLKMRKFHFS